MHYYLAATASFLILMVSWLTVHKQPAVRVVVRCQDTAQDCVNAVTRAMRKVRHLGGRLVIQMSNTGQKQPGQGAG